MEYQIFKQQIQEDIKLIKENVGWDPNINKDEYAFNYWVLSNIYNLDTEESNKNITEYNDKGIDCFVHYEEDKELYIVQNKYYNENTVLNSKEVSDFLTRPLSKLNEGKYNKSQELQNIFTNAKNDSSYKIFLHFFVTNNNISKDVASIVANYNDKNIFFELFTLADIKDKYYGKAFKESQSLITKLKIKNKGTYLAIRPIEYSLPNMSEAYYVMAKITDIFNLVKEAETKEYALFEENIREYLGGSSGINKGIIDTLKDEKQRGNFFYYNNGITIICSKAKADAREIEIVNPQVVNGCQTVNSIAEVLKHENKYLEVYNDIYVMAKILVLEKNNTDFYRNIVRYTNSQNSINDSVFGATLQPFRTIQENIKKYGFLLNVKQSDKFQNKDYFNNNKKEFSKILALANNYSDTNFYFFNTISDISINLELLIQIIGSYIKDAHFAYTKKSMLLKPSNKEYYQNFSSKIGEILTTECFVKLIILYKKAELDKKNSEDRKSPSPYYLFNFLGYYLEQNKIDKQLFLKEISISDLLVVYNEFKNLTSKYSQSYKNRFDLEYNYMIKQKVDIEIMQAEITKNFEQLKEYNIERFNILMNIFKKLR